MARRPKKFKTSPKIVVVYEDVDLRKVNTQSSTMQKLMHVTGLRHMEASLFVNRARNRFRMVVNLDGLGFLCTPEISTRTDHSLYLDISETLEKMAVNQDMEDFIADGTTRTIRKRAFRAKKHG